MGLQCRSLFNYVLITAVIVSVIVPGPELCEREGTPFVKTAHKLTNNTVIRGQGH